MSAKEEYEAWQACISQIVELGYAVARAEETGDWQPPAWFVAKSKRAKARNFRAKCRHIPISGRTAASPDAPE